MELFKLFNNVATGRHDVVRQLVESNIFTVNVQNSNATTPLLHACTYNQQSVVNVLLELGANINHQDHAGWGCLHCAAFLDHESLFTHLVSRNVNHTILTRDNRLAYQVARGKNAEKYKRIMETMPQNIPVVVPAVTSEPTLAVEPINAPIDAPSIKTAILIPTAMGNLRATNMILFPGQGGQKVGMVGKYLDAPNVQALFTRAAEILGYDLLDICQNGPVETLNDTRVCQSAVYMTSLAALLSMPVDTIASIKHAAGFSLGEYTALVFSGAIDWENGLQLVHTRAQAMADATKCEPTTMLSVIGLSDAVIMDICKQANVHVANYLFDKARVLSGLTKNIQMAKQLAIANQCTRVKDLPVSGAFHSPYMGPARPLLDKALREIQYGDMKCHVYTNIDGTVYTTKTIQDNLLKQLVSPVHWEQLVRRVNADKYYEVGCGNQLKAMMKRIDLVAWKNTINV